jgi:hypothetical protein
MVPFAALRVTCDIVGRAIHIAAGQVLASPPQGAARSIVKVLEVIAGSDRSFDDAAQ